MDERSWGLIAVARSGQVDLNLDGSTDSGEATYMLTLCIPLVELRFEVAGLDAPQVMSSFLRENYGQKSFAEMQIGVLDLLPVRLIKDDEHFDRFFLRAGRDGMIYVTLIDPVASDLVRASMELADAIR